MVKSGPEHRPLDPDSARTTGWGPSPGSAPAPRGALEDGDTKHAVSKGDHKVAS